MTMLRPQAGNRPKEVDVSFWLWISTFALGVLGMIFSYQQIDDIQDEAVRQALADNPTIDRTTVENITAAGFTVGLVLALLFIGAIVAMFLPPANAWFRPRQSGF